VTYTENPHVVVLILASHRPAHPQALLGRQPGPAVGSKERELKRIRFVLLLVLAAALTAVFASSALAVDVLQTAPAQQRFVGFESPSDSLPVYALDLGDPQPAAATWGPASAEHLSGGYGLWCAGSMPGAFPNYPSPTRGQAVLSVPDTTNYYQSWIQFSYIEPGYGALENTNPFGLNWVDATDTPIAGTTGLPGYGYAQFWPSEVPARKTEAKPEPSQSSAAPPPPTKNSHGPS